jgi:hypothetical protein
MTRFHIIIIIIGTKTKSRSRLTTRYRIFTCESVWDSGIVVTGCHSLLWFLESILSQRTEYTSHGILKHLTYDHYLSRWQVGSKGVPFVGARRSRGFVGLPMIGDICRRFPFSVESVDMVVIPSL